MLVNFTAAFFSLQSAVGMSVSPYIVGAATLMVISPPFIGLLRPDPGSATTRERAPPWMKEKVDQIARKVGIPEDKVFPSELSAELRW